VPEAVVSFSCQWPSSYAKLFSLLPLAVLPVPVFHSSFVHCSVTFAVIAFLFADPSTSIARGAGGIVQVADGNTASSATGSGSSAPNSIFADFSAAMASLMPSFAAAQAGGTSSVQRTGRQSVGGTSLQFVLQPDAIISLIREDPLFAESLLGHLPPGQQNVEDLVEIVREPLVSQFLF
jgi:hypothetical protein